MEVKSVLICGVGGQGIILASDILSDALFLSGFEVKKNEIHGMSQREGSVVSFIRYGKEVFSPVIDAGGADFLLSFEKLEAIRNIKMVKKDCFAVVNTQEILPTPVQMGLAGYPDNITDVFAKVTSQFQLVNALEAAKEAGNTKAVNIILLGVLSNAMPEVKPEAWEKAMKTHIKEAFLEMNLKAFEIGKRL